MQSIGFIGLGVMGEPMAANLLDAGYFVATSSHRKPAPERLIEKGLRVEANPKMVAQTSDIVILMLPDTAQVEAVLFAHDGLATGLSDGKIVVDMSSISPAATKDFATRIGALGCGYLDAPVSGGDVGAKSGTLSIMVGGNQDIFETVQPVFDALGENINLVGENGDGQTAKISNQIIVATTILAVGEALLFASKSGADPERIRKALLGGFANSKILDLHGKRMIDRSFEAGFRIRLHQKDLELALASGLSLPMAMPTTALCQQLFIASAALDLGDLDHSALVQSLETLCDHSVA